MSRYALKDIKRLMGKAINDYHMTMEGDHILVGVSGGKDSISLLWLLRERLKRLPIKYRVTAAHINPGFDPVSTEKIRDFFIQNSFDHVVLQGDFGPRAHSPENRENPCFFCAMHRRRALFKLADKLGCNKIALGHHKDDMIETFFMNILYGGSVSTILPVQEFFKGKIKVIRPFYLMDENLIKRYTTMMGWEAIDLGCPTAGNSKREEIRKMLHAFYRSNKKIKGNVFHAITNVKKDYLP
ncbi:MAG: tRNA 2-thiocytidine biosynthesis protein TtcA [Deltaproteobacteria bacterium]|nr:tRNA 2-thiocytidine biosynthesis protein TtcA [Deltaproteobacteria bacterium]